jgi:hypothetical protein
MREQIPQGSHGKLKVRFGRIAPHLARREGSCLTPTTDLSAEDEHSELLREAKRYSNRKLQVNLDFQDVVRMR